MPANASDHTLDDESTSTDEEPRLASEPGDTESSGLQAPRSSRHPEHSVPWDCWRHCGPRLGWWLLACVLAWLLGLPFWLDLVLFAGLLAVAVVAGRAQWLAFSVSYLFAIVSLELAVRALTKPGEVQQFYRPHEMMERHVSAQPALDPPLPRYEPNAKLDFEMPFGDLVAVDRGAPKAIFQPRKVHFRTDKYGLRNDADYSGQRILLVGDSFVAGTGSDQSLCMANVLAQKHDILAYSLAHVHAPDHYMARLDWGFKRLPVPSDTKGLAFIFEGNDFVSPQPLSGRPPAVPGWYDARKLETIAGVRKTWRTTEHVFNASRQLERLRWPMCRGS